MVPRLVSTLFTAPFSTFTPLTRHPSINFAPRRTENRIVSEDLDGLYPVAIGFLVANGQMKPTFCRIRQQKTLELCEKRATYRRFSPSPERLCMCARDLWNHPWRTTMRHTDRQCAGTGIVFQLLPVTKVHSRILLLYTERENDQCVYKKKTQYHIKKTASS